MTAQICYRCSDALVSNAPDALRFTDENGIKPCTDCLQELIEESEEAKTEAWNEEFDSSQNIPWDDYDD